MILRFAFGIGFLLCVSGFGLATTINQFAIVEAVNAALPRPEQFDPFWSTLSKTLKLQREYRRLYPNGTLLRRQAILIAAMFASCLLAALFFGFGILVVVWSVPMFVLLWFIYFKHAF